MSEIHKHWTSNCSDERLLNLLNDANRLKAEGKPIPPLVDTIKAEIEKRGIASRFNLRFF